MDIHWDGQRRWFEDGARELEPDTRDAPFLVWQDGAFGHTPVLRHVGLEREAPADVEVLQFNIASGSLVAVTYRYTPLGGGRWRCEDTNYAETTEIHLDGDGLVHEVSGRLRRV